VARDPHTGFAAVLGQPVLDAGHGETLTEAVEEQSLILHGGAHGQPGQQGIQGLGREVGDALGAVLAVQPQTW